MGGQGLEGLEMAYNVYHYNAQAGDRPQLLPRPSIEPMRYLYYPINFGVLAKRSD